MKGACRLTTTKRDKPDIQMAFGHKRAEQREYFEHFKRTVPSLWQDKQGQASSRADEESFGETLILDFVCLL